MQFVETAIRGGVAFDHDKSYAAPIDLILRAGFNVGKRTTVVTSLSQTVAGEMRTPWTLSLGLTVNYERHTHSHAIAITIMTTTIMTTRTHTIENTQT